MSRQKMKWSLSAALIASAAGLGVSPAMAQDSGSALDEVVVTAQKREQNLQDVGVAVSAVNESTLDLIGSSDHTALAKVVPSLQVSAYSPSSTIYNIRGVSQNDFSDIQEGPVAFYNDEVYVGTLGGISGQTFDLQRVEVLRGPQGTLFGRNATGGLVQVVPNRPTDHLDGYATLTGGDYGQVKFEGAIGGPLSESVRGRLAVSREVTDGYVENLAGGDDWGNTDFLGLRGQLEIDLSPNDFFRFTAQYLRNDEERGNAIGASVAAPDFFLGVGGDSLGIPVGPTENPFFTCAGCDAYGYRPPEDPWANASDFEGLFDREYQSYTARYEHDFGTIQLTSISNYQYMDKVAFNDFDATPNPLVQGGVASTVDQISQEFRLSSTSDFVTWVAGVYYMKLNHDSTSDVFVDPVVFDIFSGFGLGFLGQQITYQADQSTESAAVFGQAEWQLNDTFRLITGLRYTNDDKSYHFVSQIQYDDPLGFGFGLFPFVYDFNARRPDLANQTFENWSGKLQLEARWTDDLLTYIGVNRGTKAGGFNSPNVFPNGPGLNNPGQPVVDAALAAFDEGMVFDQEELTNYEGGFKWTFADNRANLNGTVFHYQYDNYQAFENIAGNTQIYNFDAEVTGLELELTARPLSNLDISAFVTHMFDATIKDFDLPSPAPGVPGRVVDRNLPQTPEWTFGVSGSYEQSLGSIGSLTFATTWKYNSEQNLQPFNSQADFEDAYTVGDVRITYVNEAHNFEFAVFANNVTDEAYRVFVGDNAVFGTTENVYGRPRWVGASLTYRFGQ